ncbi:fungal-specific transcription factor domain-containing protein [Trametes gibbosa]|nr:fungal-specific transcription factor domain-containing protein [Trametes gibbosa]UVI59163.1 Zn(2)-Cys(6)65 [Trametes gibbosa]
MALKSLSSPSSGDSNSPSPDLASDGPSLNASPISASTSLYISQVSDEGDSAGNQSSRGTPTRFMSDLTRSSSAGKGGCWTCRVRRKKCDEEREGDSCKTCLRLRIKCLGWGPKRPDWMRDKEKVAAYKADIKEQLSRMGLIRGQPRQPWHAGLTSQPPTPGIAGPGPHSLRRSSSAREYRREAAYLRGSPYHHLVGLPGAISAADHHPHNLASSSSSRSNSMASPMINFLPTPTSATMPDSMYGYRQSGSSVSLSGGDDARYNFLPPQGLPMPAPPVPSSTSVRQDEYITYYFKHVGELQYVFCGDALANILYPIVQQEPNGVVALSLCALAALHHSRARMAQGADPIVEDPDNENSLPRQFYDRVLYRLMHAPQTNGTGQFAETDAIAAVQLIAYAVLGGGTMDWAAPLEYACEWLAQTGIFNEENPKLTLLKMSATGRFAAKAIMFIDVLASITLKQPPRFLPLYKRLFGGGAGFWANHAGAGMSGQHTELRMDALTGCPDDALLALAEVSALAHWKASELQNGSLSVRELIRRGDIIEKELRERATGVHVDEDEYHSQGAMLAGLDMGVAAAGMPMAMGLPQVQPGMSGAARSPRGPVDTTKHVIGEMFRESALLYLHTVLSDSSPGVPEIINSVEQMMKLLDRLPPSAYDRTLVFPLFLTGCMTNNQMMREVIKHRFFMQDATMGNILLAQTVMENIWLQREAACRMPRPGDRIVALSDWRDGLRMQWASLLLV